MDPETRKQASELKDQELDTLLAEGLGWTRCRRCTSCNTWNPPGTDSLRTATTLPALSSDRNAIQGALRESLRTPELRRRFVGALCDICDRRFGNSEVSPSDVLDPNEMVQMFLLDAECRDYAEALAVTLGLAAGSPET